MTLSVKWVIQDLYSELSDNTVEETFNLILLNQCADNELTQIGGIEDVLHYLQYSSPTYVAAEVEGSISSSDCPLTYNLFFWDEPNYSWEEYTEATASVYPFVQSFSSLDGTLEVSSTDYLAHSNTSIRTKIVVTDESSGSTLNSVEDQFNLYLRDECHDVSIDVGISGLIGTEAAPYEWHMWQLQEVLFTGVEISIWNCPVSYLIT